MVWFWLSLTIVLTVVEMSTVQFVSLWFAVGSAISTIVVAIFPTMNIGWQILIFSLTSAALLVATRPLVKKFLARRTEEQKTNLDLIIGKDAIVTEPINNTLGTGAVRISGLVWSARTIDESTAECDEIVIVEKIVGNKLIIKKKG